LILISVPILGLILISVPKWGLILISVPILNPNNPVVILCSSWSLH